MRTAEFLLFRLNLVDRQDLFAKPIVNDGDLIQVFEAAATDRFDIAKQARRSSYKWSLRNVSADSTEEGRAFIEVTLSREVETRRGPIITSDGITQGTSKFYPPPATLVRIVVDLARHIVAVEEVPSVTQAHTGWKSNLQTILASAAWDAGFTSMLRLDEVVPTEVLESRLQQFEKVTRIRVTLSIPNPDLGPSFQRLYDEMKAGGVRELTQDMRSEQGLNVEPGTLPREAVNMAVTGYRKGKIRLYGLSRGERKDLTIADDVARIQIEGLRDFVEGYAAGRSNAEVKRFARAVVQRIDESLDRQARE